MRGSLGGEMMPHYWWRVRREGEARVDEDHSFTGSWRIRLYFCLLHFFVILRLLELIVMDNFTIIGRFADISLDELSDLQGEFVRLFRRFPAASVT
jgi:hypothetical protein